VSLSPSAVSFEAAQGGADPGPQNVRVTVTGEAVPHLGVVQYGAEGQGWLSPSLGAAAGGETVLTLRAAARGLAEPEDPVGRVLPGEVRIARVEQHAANAGPKTVRKS